MFTKFCSGANVEIKISNEWLRKAIDTPWHKSEDDYKPAIPFAVDVGQARQLNEWLGEHRKTCIHRATEDNPFPGGAIGGILTYTFCHTGLGTVTRVQCACGSEVDLTEYGDW